MTLTSQLRFGAVFIGLFLGFQALYYTIPDGVLHGLIHHGIVDVAAGAINLLSPAEQVSAHGQRLVSSQAALEVIRGCDGSGAAFMLVAAVIALGASTWRRLLLGVAGALALMYLLNQLRIVALYYVLANWPGRFDDVHEYAAPALLILLSSAAFLAWAMYLSRGPLTTGGEGLAAAAAGGPDSPAADRGAPPAGRAGDGSSPAGGKQRSTPARPPRPRGPSPTGSPAPGPRRRR